MCYNLQKDCFCHKYIRLENAMENTKNYSISAQVCLAEALISLMQHTSIDTIHIKDIAKKAGVSRMSYYRYFSTKEEILSFYMEYILKEYLSTVDTARFQSYQHILDSLNFFYNYRDFALCLHEANLSFLLLDALNDYIEKQPGFQQQNPQLTYSLYYYAGALYNIFMQWILNGTKEKPEIIAKTISDLCNK